MRTTAAALTAAIVLAIGAAGAQATDDGGPDNVVNATTSGTGSTDVRSRLRVGSYGGDDLRSENVGAAYSHDCTDCRTVAVAVQAVFATGHPSTVEPKNVAVALNERCLRCSTFAFAYQYVVTTDGRVHLNRETRHDIRHIRREIDDVAHSDLAPPDMDARLHELAAEFKSEIDAGLAADDEHGHGHAEERHEEE